MNQAAPSLAVADAYLSPAELDAVSRLARDAASPARLRLAEIAADLLDGSLGGPERLLVTDVLLRLLSKAQDDLRQVISTRLASSPSAPHELVLFLANDDITVARPVLTGSPVLTDADLMDVVRRRSVFHSRSIALRAALSELVGECLVGTGDNQTIAFLLRNAGVRLSAAAALSIAKSARSVEELRRPLLHRPDISPEAAAALYWHVPEELRTYIQTRFSAKLSGSDADGQQFSRPAVRESDLVYRNGAWVIEGSNLPGRG